MDVSNTTLSSLDNSLVSSRLPVNYQPNTEKYGFLIIHHPLT